MPTRLVCQLTLIGLAIVLGACNTSTPLSPTSTDLPTATQTALLALPRTATATRSRLAGPEPFEPSLTPTKTATPRPRPTNTPTPQPTITPVEVIKIQAHPLALNANNFPAQPLLQLGTGAIYDVAWSPDGRYLVAATELGVSFYDANTFELVEHIETDQAVTHFALRPDGRRLALTYGTTISIWNVDTGKRVADLNGEFAGRVAKIVYAQNGYIAAYGDECKGCGDAHGGLKLWDSFGGQPIYEQHDLWPDSKAIAFSPDEKNLSFYGETGLEIRALNSQKLIASWPTTANYSIVFNTDGSQLLSSASPWAETGPEVRLWDIATDASQLSWSQAPCSELAAGGLTAVCYNQSHIVVFDRNTGLSTKTISVTAPLRQVDVSPDGHQLALMESNAIRVIEIATDHVIKTLPFDRFAGVTIGSILLNNEVLNVAAIGNLNGEISVWNLLNGEQISAFHLNDRPITYAFSPDRRTLAIATGKHRIHLWDIPRNSPTYTFHLEKTDISSIRFSPDGRKMAIEDTDQTLFELDLQSNQLEKLGEAPFHQYIYSTSNHLVVLRYPKNSVALQDLATQSEVTPPLTVTTDYDFVESMAVSPDNSLVALGTIGASIYIWNINQQKFTHTLIGHEIQGGDGWAGSIRSLQFSPQTNLLVSVGWDRTTRVWNTHTGHEIRTLNICCEARFTPDGRFLVTISGGVIRVWGLPDQ